MWSSACNDHVDDDVEHIFPARSALKFVWGGQPATFRRLPPTDFDVPDPWKHMRYHKPLTKMRRSGWPLERVLIANASHEKCVKNYGNALLPRPFIDDELVMPCGPETAT